MKANQKNAGNSSWELWPTGIVITGFFETHFHSFHFKLPWPWQPHNSNSSKNWAKATAEVFNSQYMAGLPENVYKCHIWKCALFWTEYPWHSLNFHRSPCQKNVRSHQARWRWPTLSTPYSVKHIIRKCSSYLVTKETAGVCSSKVLRPDLWVNKPHACLG